jgi:hypothetical protein
MPGSGNILIDAIAGIGWLGRGGDRNITYFFENNATHGWTAREKDAWRSALQQFANVANITIQEVGSAASADLSERWVSNSFLDTFFDGATAVHEFPKSSPPAVGSYNSTALPISRPAGLPPAALALPSFCTRSDTRLASRTRTTPPWALAYSRA